MRSTSKIIIQSLDCNNDKRMVSLSKQFGRLIEDQGETIPPKSSMLLRFETSAEHPLTMGELSYFFDENRDFLEGRNIEWCSDCATNLGDKVLITLSFEPHK